MLKLPGPDPHLTALQKAYGDRVSIVALNSEPIDVLNQFMKEHGDELSYAVGHISKEVMSRFIEGTPGVPYCYIIDKKGVSSGRATLHLLRMSLIIY